MQDAPTDQANPDGRERQSPEDIALVAGAPDHAGKQQPPTASKNGKPKKKECWTSYEKATFFITLAGVVVVAIYTIVTYKQAKLARQAIVVSAEATKIQTRATLKIIDWKIDRASIATNKPPII